VSCDALASAVAGAVGDLATVTTSVVHDRFGMAELSVPGVTKASALAELCGELDLAASDVVAFGDMPNDAAMLEWAGHAYVMADGHPSLLGRFDSAGSCGDAGVGRTLRVLLESATSPQPPLSGHA
jgi:hydroxymethylpyrimidine pyrophosphatase-like HAD family hydrolase